MIKIQSIEYHRNGVGGNPFYAVEASQKAENKTKQKLLITFETDFENRDEETGEHIDAASVRVLTPDSFSFRWRGDYYAHELTDRLNLLQKRKKAQSFYGLIGLKLDGF